MFCFIEFFLLYSIDLGSVKHFPVEFTAFLVNTISYNGLEIRIYKNLIKFIVYFLLSPNGLFNFPHIGPLNKIIKIA